GSDVCSSDLSRRAYRAPPGRSYVLLASAGDRDLAFVSEPAHDRKDFLLRALHLADPHRPSEFEIFLERFARAFRQIAEEMLLDLRGRALERDDEELARQLAENPLHAAIVDLEQVLEREHQLLDLHAQVRVVLADLVEDRRLRRHVHVVQDVRGALQPAHDGGLRRIAGELTLEDLVELLQRVRMNRVERRDAHHDIAAQPLREVAEHLGRVIAVEIRDDDRDDLRVLVADHVRDRTPVHPLQRLEALRLPADEDAIDQRARAILAERLDEHLAHVILAAEPDRRLLDRKST